MLPYTHIYIIRCAIFPAAITACIFSTVCQARRQPSRLTPFLSQLLRKPQRDGLPYQSEGWWRGTESDGGESGVHLAMDRIHRLGQHRPIKITRLIIENSIESRIVQLQEKKTALVESTIGKDSSALAKLSEDDLRFLFVL
ncbi:hypothetical protein BC936DRAFT_149338 [Jimgerdemannia flammicorona]|uniref:Uncharacterized protein n=1 Tax=Jimgerdemannia flammicorona TaxID=994334 RepID=A0A433D122_9FUNG|nr:hypothetical protein BC936DRAFT_149338 [Jimgerdemannia flammicorona]